VIPARWPPALPARPRSAASVADQEGGLKFNYFVTHTRTTPARAAKEMFAQLDRETGR
jgi:hypothetical protein